MQYRGRAWAILPGEEEPIRIQAFIAQRDRVAAAVMDSGGPQDATPWVIEGQYREIMDRSEEEKKIRQAVREQLDEGAGNKLNFSRIAEAIGRAAGGSSWRAFTRKVTRIWTEEVNAENS
jgi:hypothetical protein